MNNANTKVLGVVLIAVGLFLIFVFYGGNFISINKAGSQTAQIVNATNSLEKEIQKPQKTTIAFVGDICSIVESKAWLKNILMETILKFL